MAVTVSRSNTVPGTSSVLRKYEQARKSHTLPPASVNSTAPSCPPRASQAPFLLAPSATAPTPLRTRPPFGQSWGPSPEWGPSPPGAWLGRLRRALTGVPEAPSSPGKRWRKAQWQVLRPLWGDSWAATTLPRGTALDTPSFAASSFRRDRFRGRTPRVNFAFPRRGHLPPYASCKARHQAPPPADLDVRRRRRPRWAGPRWKKPTIPRGGGRTRPERKKPRRGVRGGKARRSSDLDLGEKAPWWGNPELPGRASAWAGTGTGGGSHPPGAGSVVTAQSLGLRSWTPGRSRGAVPTRGRLPPSPVPDLGALLTLPSWPPGAHAGSHSYGRPLKKPHSKECHYHADAIGFSPGPHIWWVRDSWKGTRIMNSPEITF